MKENKSLFGKLKNLIKPKKEEQKPHWNSKDWIEIKAPSGSSQPNTNTLRMEKPKITPIQPTKGPAIPQSAHVLRPTTKDRIQSERTTYSGRDPAKPVERMSADDLKKKWPGAFEQKK